MSASRRAAPAGDPVGRDARAAELAADAAFLEVAAAPALPATVSVMEAMRRGRQAVDQVTGLQVDAVAACSPEGDGWRVIVDVIEAPARLGDNDLLATYEVLLDGAGEVQRFQRTGRYNRTEVAR